MRFVILFYILILQLIGTKSFSQDIINDTFIRKDGIHLISPFQPWQTATLFGLKKPKNKHVSSQPLLNLDACERIRYYSSSAFSNKKTEPFRFFKVLDDLEAHDSSSYFQVLTDMPLAYQSFFKALYDVEDNQFAAALPLFNDVLAGGSADSLLLAETPFWKDITAKMLSEQLQHQLVFSAYTLMEQPHADSAKLMELLQQISLPQYMMHKYINLYNYHFHKKDYEGARFMYDSIVAYANNSKMKTSLVKNRNAVQELLAGKEKFIAAIKNDLYHYKIDYLYDHLEIWRHDTLTDKEFAALAGFSLDEKYTTKFDSVFTRNLIDTAANDLLSKFEVLSLSRTTADKGGRRFVIVKLGFSNEDTYKQYHNFLQKFKSKSIQQSILYNRGGEIEGDEYMLTKYFIAALFLKNDPVIKYELSLYSLEDTEGNSYAVDTLF